MKKILGMGNALVDIMVALESDAMLEKLSLPKGSMQLVDAERSNAILSALKDYPKSLSAGGSAANTIHGLGMMGANAGYIGMVGEDDLGGFFVRDMIRAGVDPYLIHSSRETGRAVALVTPDSERTFATYLGAAVELSASHLTSPQGERSEGVSAIFGKYDYFHIEGYLVQNHELILRAVKLAKECGLTVSLDLASYNVVEANRDFLLSVVKDYVDILFANEEEAKAFTGLEPEEAVRELSRMAGIAVVKTGPNGSLVMSETELHRIGVIDVTPVDTTGAGDLYAAGFLLGLAGGAKGLAGGKPLRACGELGSLLAGNVIEFMGAKMPDERWGKIRGGDTVTW